MSPSSNIVIVATHQLRLSHVLFVERTFDVSGSIVHSPDVPAQPIILRGGQASITALPLMIFSSSSLCRLPHEQTLCRQVHALDASLALPHHVDQAVASDEFGIPLWRPNKWIALQLADLLAVTTCRSGPPLDHTHEEPHRNRRTPLGASQHQRTSLPASSSSGDAGAVIVQGAATSIVRSA